jgi:hypothetical protein
MPQTVWRPYPSTFIKPTTKFDNAAHQRQKVIDAIRGAGRPLTMLELADVLGFDGDDGYNQTRRYVLKVAFPTRSKVIVRGRRLIGWTLKEEHR